MRLNWNRQKSSTGRVRSATLSYPCPSISSYIDYFFNLGIPKPLKEQKSGTARLPITMSSSANWLAAQSTERRVLQPRMLILRFGLSGSSQAFNSSCEGSTCGHKWLCYYPKGGINDPEWSKLPLCYSEVLNAVFWWKKALGVAFK